MARPSVSPLQRQIGRVSRRLLLQTFLSYLLWCWFGALLLSAAWFVAQPWLFAGLAHVARLSVAGGLVGAGAILAALLAFFRTPSKITAALLLDERFGLKERVTTSLTLAPEQEATPAAQALLADVNQRVSPLNVGSRFPLRLSWTTTLMPVCAALLAVAAFYYQPQLAQATSSTASTQEQPLLNAAEIERKLNNLKKQQPREQRPADMAVSEELKRIEAELDKIASKPRGSKEQLRERVKEMTALEERMKNREKDLAERSEAVKQQLQQLDRMSKEQASQNGPAKDLQKALSQGNLEQAKEELERLAKKVKNHELTDKEKEQLAKQMEDIQKKLERLAEQKDKEQQLQKMAEAGKLDAETLKRELEKLKQDAEKLKDLQDVAQQLQQCQQCLKQGNAEGAAQSLKQAADKLKEMGAQDQEVQDLREQLQRLQDAKDSC